MTKVGQALQPVQTHLVGAAHGELRKHVVSSNRKKVALVIAGVADLIQLGLFPFFAEGALSIPDDVLDIVVAIALFITLGFQWRIIAALGIELIPGIALFPSWTALVATLPVEAHVQSVQTVVEHPQIASRQSTR